MRTVVTSAGVFPRKVVIVIKSGIYVHVPFCAAKCRYCDFYSITWADSRLKEDYADAVMAEMDRHEAEADTLYFGGGTPPLWGVSILRVIDKAYERFGLDCAEITVEANPECTELIPELAKAGVNRISFGMQSSSAGELSALGRGHGKDISSAVAAAKKAGISNISVDIMLGVPYQTRASLEQTLDRVKGYGITHVSAYILSLSENTPLYRSKDARRIPDDDTIADMYLMTADYLSAEGFAQYEISNFAKPGYECRHNLKYWNLEPYIGFGAAAHSFIANRRYAHSKDIEAYISNPADDLYCYDQNAGQADEFVMLQLRLAAGMDLDKAERLHGIRRDKIIAAVEGLEGLAAIKNGAVCLTPRGMLVSNGIIGQLTMND
ncbi:MAG: radical SAM family heme chaperone HemW [Oscillospiraceae bacterium]|nr:radical SAM family heme chaperone HemW [Oscillospiraceae bacterium]